MKGSCLLLARRLAPVVIIGLGFGLSLPGAPVEPTGVSQLRRHAAALAPLAQSPLAQDFLRATTDLSSVSSRTIYRDGASGKYYSKVQADRLSPELRTQLKPIAVDESLYYNTKYGSPLAYVRPLEVLGHAGVAGVEGMRILDFGYGTTGHLRLLASLGANVVGVDVDPLLPALYSEPSDQGIVKSSNSRAREGKITLVHGHFPGDPDVARGVGNSYDLIISKNTLKNGYLHPAQPVDKRMLVDLGVTDAEFVRTLYRALNPGGKVLVYNICPAPNPPGKPYLPWADGRCPFSKGMWEAAGFRVAAFDHDDSVAVRQMAHVLEWDRGTPAINLEKDLFAHYTLVEKPSGR
jgi:SAM-dependent methyltransferase